MRNSEPDFALHIIGAGGSEFLIYASKLIKFFLILVFFTAPLTSIFTQDANNIEALNVRKGFFSFFSINLGASILFFPADPKDLSYDVAPVLPSPHFGFGIPFTFPGNTTLSFELSYDGYLNNYLVPDTPSPQRPFPAAAEQRSTFVIGNIAGIQFQGKTEFAHFVSLRYSAGVSFDLRIIMVALDLNENDMEDAEYDTEIARDYFWDNKHFIFPSVGIGVDFRTSPGTAVGMEFRFWIPLYQEDYALEGWRFGAAFRLTFLNETPDSKIRRGLEIIKTLYKTERNDYTFILYHLENNNIGKAGISPRELAAEIQKTYKHSRIYPADRKSINNTIIVNMFSDMSEVLNYTYDPMGDVIMKK